MCGRTNTVMAQSTAIASSTNRIPKPVSAFRSVLMSDVVQHNVMLAVMRVRECARHVWNALFLNMGRDPDFDDVDVFDDMCRKMFYSQVLRGRIEVEDTDQLFRRSFPYLLVRPADPKSANLQLHINRNRGDMSRYWDHHIGQVHFPGTVLHFVSYFDFDLLGNRDLQYIRVYIAACDAVPDIVGHYALVEADPNTCAVWWCGTSDKKTV